MEYCVFVCNIAPLVTHQYKADFKLQLVSFIPTTGPVQNFPTPALTPGLFDLQNIYFWLFLDRGWSVSEIVSLLWQRRSFKTTFSCQGFPLYWLLQDKAKDIHVFYGYQEYSAVLVFHMLFVSLLWLLYCFATHSDIVCISVVLMCFTDSMDL